MIDKDKTYRTRDGRNVTILCVDRKHPEYPVIALVERGDGFESSESYTSNGHFSAHGCEHHLDLIEVKPFEDFKIDEPVLVRNTPDEQWQRRYFAGVTEDGYPTTWPQGATSWSAVKDGNLTYWAECRRPTPEELPGEGV